jgi:hypothetical protein
MSTNWTTIEATYIRSLITADSASYWTTVNEAINTAYWISILSTIWSTI